MEGDARSIKSQMRRADKLRAVQVLIIGDNELTQNTAALRDMAKKQQREVILTNINAELVGRKAI
jgi:histidyl-tRNA synthetase